jgi:hypothetical protein
MTTETHSQFEHFLSSICNLIRGLYKSEDYREVILPLTIRRHFEFLKARSALTGVVRREPAVRRKAIESFVAALEDDIKRRHGEVTG